MTGVTRAVLEKIHKTFPPPVSAWLRFVQGHRMYFYPYGFAMNGQTARLEATRQILFRCGIRQIVETGTFRGTTTEWLAGFGMPVITIEAYDRSYYFSKRRLRDRKNVRTELGDSVAVLKRLVDDIDTSVPTFFYLDAHWKDYLPLHDEMALILPHFAAPVILIDDFEVPGQAGYEYDNYGPGKALTTEYLKECLTPGMSVFYPSTPAEQETGSRRGWVVVTPDAEMDARLDKIELLRRTAVV
jgi:hypothetical protein